MVDVSPGVVSLLGVFAEEAVRLLRNGLRVLAGPGDQLRRMGVGLLLQVAGGVLRVGEDLLGVGQRFLGARQRLLVMGVRRRLAGGLLALRLRPPFTALLVLLCQHPGGAPAHLPQRGHRLAPLLRRLARCNAPDLVGLGLRGEQPLPGAFVAVGAHGIGVRLRGLAYADRGRPGPVHALPRFPQRPLPYGRGLLPAEFEEPLCPFAERLVGLGVSRGTVSRSRSSSSSIRRASTVRRAALSQAASRSAERASAYVSTCSGR